LAARIRLETENGRAWHCSFLDHISEPNGRSPRSMCCLSHDRRFPEGSGGDRDLQSRPRVARDPARVRECEPTKARAKIP
jgi:hypothetical protein